MKGYMFSTLVRSLPILRAHFLGVFSIDTLPRRFPVHKFALVNTARLKSSGKHWLIFYRPSGALWEIFDSLANNESLVKEALEDNNFVANRRRVQCQDSSLCGEFCLYFILHRVVNLSETFENVIDSLFEAHISCEANEAAVAEFITWLEL